VKTNGFTQMVKRNVQGLMKRASVMLYI